MKFILKVKTKNGLQMQQGKTFTFYDHGNSNNNQYTERNGNNNMLKEPLVQLFVCMRSFNKTAGNKAFCTMRSNINSISNLKFTISSFKL